MVNHVQGLKAATLRFFHRSGAVVGAGFLVSERHVMTCAHVVAASLGLPTNTEERPTETAELDFPLVAPDVKIQAQVVLWNPVNPGQTDEDIAVLEVLQPIPSQALPVNLIKLEDPFGQSIRAFGFPKGHDSGLWVTGVLRDESTYGWVQIDALASQDRPIEYGFSGAPIWSEQLQGIVGMTVAAEKRRSNVTSAFMIPTAILKTAWSLLGIHEPTPQTEDGLEVFIKVRLKNLRKREGVLVKQYEAAYNQLNYELSDANKVAIAERIKLIEEELQQVSREISSLLT